MRILNWGFLSLCECGCVGVRVFVRDSLGKVKVTAIP